MIEMLDPPGPALALAAEFDIIAGCDKRFETCRTKFANHVNFRGFPYMPGNDAAQAGPQRGAQTRRLVTLQMIARSAILDEARSWLGTPYQHQASAKDAGCDCLGLVRGVWRALYGAEPEAAPAYTPDWAEREGEETLYAAACAHLDRIKPDDASPGDVLLFRMSAEAPIKHAAILDDEDYMLHAYWGRAVLRSRLNAWWRARLAAAFSFPDTTTWPR